MAAGRHPGRKPGATATGATPPAAGERFQLGPFWLWYREDRDEWCIVWRNGSRGTRRKTTGIGGRGDHPPEAAREALADHWTAWKASADSLAPAVSLPPGEVLLADLTAGWLEQHVAHLDAPERYLDSVAVWDAFWDHLDAQGLLPKPLVVSAVTNGIVDLFIAWRRGQGASNPTISRDIAAVRGPINWGMRPDVDRLTVGPRIKDVKGRKAKKELEWSPEQIAVILETARASVEREHVFMFALTSLSTHGRSEAILEFDIDEQYRGGLLHFLRPGEEQTRKRRPIVPACPTLATWLAGQRGKLIVYRVPIAARRWADPAVPEYFERPTSNIANAFDGVLLAAHEARPDLGFARQRQDERGKLKWLPPRKKLGESAPRPDMETIGSPNTLRHTIHTWHKRQGVPEAQIDAAAGHSEAGTGASYTHLRPDYLREFIASTEAFWAAVGEFTDAHRLYQSSTNVASLAATRAAR